MDRILTPRAWLTRYDYFLIWGHGLQFAESIVDLIASCDGLRIVRLQYHRPKNIRRFVRVVYSYDYAPLLHLKDKTNYLLGTQPLVLFVFVENLSPAEIMVGEGVFRHAESSRIKALKEHIRDHFNERREDRRTENHVVHASDNQMQTDQILKYIGVREGTIAFRKRPNQVIDTAYHLPSFYKFRFENAPVEKLCCTILRGTPDDFCGVTTPLAETPHASYLRGDKTAYEEYLAKFGGWHLCDYYSLRKFQRLSETFDYERLTAVGCYIVVGRQKSGRLVILDGVHRAAILASRGAKNIPVVIAE